MPVRPRRPSRCASRGRRTEPWAPSSRRGGASTRGTDGRSPASRRAGSSRSSSLRPPTSDASGHRPRRGAGPSTGSPSPSSQAWPRSSAGTRRPVPPASPSSSLPGGPTATPSPRSRRSSPPRGPRSRRPAGATSERSGAASPRRPSSSGRGGRTSPFSSSPISRRRESRPQLAEALRQRLRTGEAAERRAGRALFGPHRDDVRVVSGPTPLSARASSGEARTLVLAWALAERALVAEAAGSLPVFAFDDFDSEWDPVILARFAEALPDDGQVFLTSARAAVARALPLPQGAVWEVEAGRIRPAGPLAGRSPSRPRRGRVAGGKVRRCPRFLNPTRLPPRSATRATVQSRSSSSRGSRRCASGPGCTSGTPTTSRGSTTWSPSSSTTPSTRRRRATATA